MRRIGVLTSGGDAPGMNAAIRAATRTATERGVEVVGIRYGFKGLIDGDFVTLGPRDVGGIIEKGGTMLGSARSQQFKTDEGRRLGIANLEAAGIDGLVVVGGNGTQTGSLSLWREGFPVNGVASTIDNDLVGSDITIGVDTAMNVCLEAIDRLRTTASSHHRLFILEVMGRDCGYLALTAGLSGGAEIIVTPEYDIPASEVLERIREEHARGKRHAMVVVAEGAKNAATLLYNEIKADPDCGFDPRITILGHVQRGGIPSAFDRLLGTRLGAHAAELLIDGRAGNVVGLVQNVATPTPLELIVGKQKPLPEELIALMKTMSL